MIKQYLATYFQDPQLKLIFKDVVGTNQPEVLQKLAENMLEQQLNLELKQILFVEFSIGVVFGLLLSNNSKVVLKVFSPKISLEYLNNMNSIVDTICAEKFPAP